MAVARTTLYACLPAPLTAWPTVVCAGGVIGAWVSLGTLGANADGYYIVGLHINGPAGQTSIDSLACFQLGVGPGGSQVQIGEFTSGDRVTGANGYPGRVWMPVGLLVAAASNLWARSNCVLFNGLGTPVSIAVQYAPAP